MPACSTVRRSMLRHHQHALRFPCVLWPVRGPHCDNTAYVASSHLGTFIIGDERCIHYRIAVDGGVLQPLSALKCSGEQPGHDGGQGPMAARRVRGRGGAAGTRGRQLDKNGIVKGTLAQQGSPPAARSTAWSRAWKWKWKKVHMHFVSRCDCRARAWSAACSAARTPPMRACSSSCCARRSRRTAHSRCAVFGVFTREHVCSNSCRGCSQSKACQQLICRTKSVVFSKCPIMLRSAKQTL